MNAWPALPTSHPPIVSLADIEALEKPPLESRIWSWNVNDWIRRGWANDPNRVAIHFLQDADPDETPESVTFEQLRYRSNQSANLFYASGVRANDAVLTLLPSVPQLFYAQFGGIAAGVACCVNWMLKPEQILDLVRNAGTRVLVVLAPTPGYEIWENVLSIKDSLPAGVRVFSVRMQGSKAIESPRLGMNADAEELDFGADFDTAIALQPGDSLNFERSIGPDDLAGYVHSGGTTGSPKLVKLTHRGFSYKCWANAMINGLVPGDSLFAINPHFHIAGFFGRGILTSAWGATMVSPGPQGARGKNFIANHWKLVEKYRITHFGGVPTTLSMLVKNPPKNEDISTLKKHGTAGSAALPVEIAKEFERVIGIRTLLTYGATEYTQNVCQAPRDGEPRYGSVGLRMPYTSVKTVVLGPDGEIARKCHVGEAGVVVVRGPSVTPGYVDDRQNQGVFTKDGYFKSGDLGRFDAEGYLWITGRAKDLIIRSGHNIEPGVIENALLKHPEVMLCAAVSKPDAYAGELPIAYVQLVQGAMVSAADLVSFAAEHVPERPAAPKEVIVLEKMPLTDVEKPDKVRLRYDAAERAFTAVFAVALGVATKFSVKAGIDENQANLITVTIAETRLMRAEIEAKIADAMKSYTYRHRAVWI
ncbi:MAG: acyl-CoA synthetase [Burkholderiales bacterium]